MEYLGAINKPDELYTKAFECLQELTTAFEEWMQDLFVLSLEGDRAHSNNEYINSLVDEMVKKETKDLLTFEHGYFDIPVNQDDTDLGASTTEFFGQFNSSRYNDNEAWLLTRVKAVAAHWKTRARREQTYLRKMMKCGVASSTVWTCAMTNLF